jgi:hypothetical protein
MRIPSNRVGRKLCPLKTIQKPVLKKRTSFFKNTFLKW